MKPLMRFCRKRMENANRGRPGLEGPVVCVEEDELAKETETRGMARRM